MILIYSKDIDDFVNEVIDYLDKDFIRIGDKDKVFINDITLSHKDHSIVIHGDSKHRWFLS